MNYEIVLSEGFKRGKTALKKVFFIERRNFYLRKELEKNPALGTPLGNNVYKIRIAIASKGKGKCGGAKIIFYVIIDGKIILLLTIYRKGEKESITDKEIKDIIKKYIG